MDYSTGRRGLHGEFYTNIVCALNSDPRERSFSSASAGLLDRNLWERAYCLLT